MRQYGQLELSPNPFGSESPKRKEKGQFTRIITVQTKKGKILTVAKSLFFCTDVAVQLLSSHIQTMSSLNVKTITQLITEYLEQRG
jgi:hypothetical protein